MKCFTGFSGISYTSRGYSQIRLDDPPPDSAYFVTVEPRADIRNLTMVVTLLPKDQSHKQLLIDEFDRRPQQPIYITGGEMWNGGNAIP